MQITNTTQYNTEDLRKVFSAVLASTNKDCTPVKHWYQRIQSGYFASKWLKIQVKNSMHGHSGSAYVNSGRMTIRIPKTDLDIVKLAFVFEHELTHCRGYRHKDMGSIRRWSHATPDNYECIKGMVVNVIEKGSKPKQDLQIKRYENVLAIYKKWEAKRKSAANRERKALESVKYYEKMFATDGRLAAIQKKK